MLIEMVFSMERMNKYRSKPVSMYGECVAGWI